MITEKELKELLGKEAEDLCVPDDDDSIDRNISNMTHRVISKLSKEPVYHLNLNSIVINENFQLRNFSQDRLKQFSDKIEDLLKDKVYVRITLTSKPTMLLDNEEILEGECPAVSMSYRGSDFKIMRAVFLDKKYEFILFENNIGLVIINSMENGVIVPLVEYVLYNDTNRKEAKELFIDYNIFINNCNLELLGIRDSYLKNNSLYRIYTITEDRFGSFNLRDLYVRPTVDFQISNEEFFENYNEDFPRDKIKEFIQSPLGGIVIFNGVPGSGKSTFIKHLVMEEPNTRFVIVPQNILFKQDQFRDFVICSSSGMFNNNENRENYIFIVEDCEKLLMARDQNITGSGVIGDILNYSDGILGDFTRTKFIFTFNTDLSKIDSAILRKGRLRLKYTFEKLRGKHLESIAKKVGYKLSDKEKKEGMTLSDLYSKNENNIIDGKVRSSVGFDVVGISEEKHI